MRIHDLVQGSDAWHQFRLEHFGASEAAAMLGLSKKVTRTELLKAKHTGLAREFSDWVQKNILEYGHEVEVLARPLVEKLIADDLYPVTCSEGKLSASCDGLTLGYEIAFEHKQWSEDLAAAVGAGEVPLEHMPQCQQILLVTNAQKVIFTVSDGTPKRFLHVDVLPDPAWFDRLRAGWTQFEKDLADYTPTPAAAPAPAGKAPDTLPALRIEVTGQVTASNLAEFKQTALAAIRSVNRELSTDVDFANAESAVKWCGEVESRLAAAKEHALSQTASIDVLFKTIDDISAEARQVRLELDKLVTKRKAEVKETITAKARAAYEAHEQALRAEGPWICLPQPDFASAVKGKRSVASLQDAVDTVLANAKIAADASAMRIRASMACLKEESAGYEFLFHDQLAFSGKPVDDVRTLARARIAEHKAKEAARMEAERERIRAEEQAKAQLEATAAAEAQARSARAAAAAEAPAPVQTQAQAQAQAVVPTHRPAVTRSDPPTLNLGAICSRLGFTMTAAFVTETLGVAPAQTDRRASLYTEHQFGVICGQLMRHVQQVRAGSTAAA